MEISHDSERETLIKKSKVFFRFCLHKKRNFVTSFQPHNSWLNIAFKIFSSFYGLYNLFWHLQWLKMFINNTSFDARGRGQTTLLISQVLSALKRKTPETKLKIHFQQIFAEQQKFRPQTFLWKSSGKAKSVDENTI